ncbi:dynamin-binding protein-like [Penaeus japonicus]|uniref:dynamin-binding protein-like n=1 Tax=Penaeus japonicus TaxID=27405 RepID=UPI001C70F5C6|nr:dynamin-binding protein-like [Penaeus japonicus]XP_042875782.1 dynamin-binding protein-like [Penaeus japonicus]XP_042875783.1 dynamin-binding protein-like [Penaeus japonicus]
MSLTLSAGSVGHAGRPHAPPCAQNPASVPSDPDDLSDFDDFSDDADEGLDTTRAQVESSLKPGRNRERVEEMVQTEKDYISDLEVLLRVINETISSSSWGENAGLFLRPLLGNVVQVMDVAKKFFADLEDVLCNSEEDMQVGRVFLQHADDLCEAYKVYCSNYNVEVIPLLKKYEGDEEAQLALRTVTEELRRHKAHLIDVNSVLIKPVQRVLKYPLYLNELLRGTPAHFRDQKNLEAALGRINDAAREINEYTRAIDLVHKYRADTDHSLQGKMKRVNFHSIVKKSNRMSTYVSQKLGIVNQTTSSKFIAEEARFRSIQKGARALVEHVGLVVDAIRARHAAELLIAEALEDVFPWALEVAKVKAVALDTCNRLLQQFDHEIEERVLIPVRSVESLCEAPDRLITKTQDKLLDLDAAQGRLQASKDSAKVAALEDEVAQARETYEALNRQLLTELPELNDRAVLVLELATRSLAAARLYFQGHLAKLYLELTAVPGFALIPADEMRDRARRQVELLQEMLPADHLRKQSLKESRTTKIINTSTKMAAALLSSRGSVDVLPKSLQRPVDALKHGSRSDYFKNLTSLSRTHSRRSAPPSVTTGAAETEAPKEPRRRSAPADYMKRLPSLSRSRSRTVTKLTQKYKKEVLRKYPAESIYEVTEDHPADGENELSLHSGDLVAVVKKKDPMGGDGRWVADNGDKMGLVRSSCLKEANHQQELAEETEESDTGPAVASAHPQVTAPRHSLPAYPESPRSAHSPSWAGGVSQRHSNPPKTTFTSYLSDDCARRLVSPEGNSHTDHAERSRETTVYDRAERSRETPVYDRAERSRETPVYDRAERSRETPVYDRAERSRETPVYDRAESRIYDIAEDSVYQEVDEVLRNKSKSRAYAEVGKDLQAREKQAPRCHDVPEYDEQQIYYALYTFTGSDATQLSVQEGQRVRVLEAKASAWWYVSDFAGNCGYVPASYLQPCVAGVSTHL